MRVTRWLSHVLIGLRVLVGIVLIVIFTVSGCAVNNSPGTPGYQSCQPSDIQLNQFFSQAQTPINDIGCTTCHAPTYPVASGFRIQLPANITSVDPSSGVRQDQASYYCQFARNASRLTTFLLSSKHTGNANFQAASVADQSALLTWLSSVSL